MPEPWSDIAQEWDSIPLEAYKFLFSQAKDRFEEVLMESKTITEKAVGLTKLSVAASAAFVGFKFTAQPGMEWIVLLSFLFIANIVCLAILMFPKGIIFKGSPPIEIFCSYLDNSSYVGDDKVNIVYYHELRRYQERIDIISKKNSTRQLYYGVALILTMLTTILTTGVIISTILQGVIVP